MHRSAMNEAAERIASSFTATIAHLEETARLEREAGIIIGEKRALLKGAEQRQTQDILIAKLESEIEEVNERRTVIERKLAETEARLIGTTSELAETERQLTDTASELAAADQLAKDREQNLQQLRKANDEIQFLLARRSESLEETTRDRDLIAQRLEAIENAAAWKITYPLRTFGEKFPAVRILARRLAKILWWSATGRLLKKLKERREYFRQIALAEQQAVISAETQRTEPSHGPTEALVEIQESDYERWIREFDTLSAEDIDLIQLHIARLSSPPVISVVMPVYNPPPEFLRAAIASVRSQFYPHWELCICDDASPSTYVAEILDEAARDDHRISWVRREENGHICAATNDALALASGEFVALMDHDDLLPPHALYSVAVELMAHPDTDMLFTDEDRIDDDGRRHTPYFKPGWNPELLLAHNCVSHLGVYRRSLINRLGGLRVGFEGSQDHDLALRASAAGEGKVRHLPGIFYHWRLTASQASASFSQSELNRCIDAARRATTEYLRLRGDIHGTAAYVGPNPEVPMWSRVRWPLPQHLPKVSIVIPTRDYPELLAQCVQGVLHRTEYQNVEIIVADNDSSEPATLELFKRLRVDPRITILSCPGAFNYSGINNKAVRASSGEIVVLLNNDIDIIGGSWLSELVSIAMRPEVGAVGAKLLYGSGTVQHAGVALGIGRYKDGPGVAGHFGWGEQRSDPGYFGQNILSRDLSAVTAACLAVRRDVFDTVGGLDEQNLKVAFNDVDFCLRVRAAGFRVIWTPYAELYHLESASRGSDEAPDKVERFGRECQYMRDRWGPILDNDPFYNPVFSRLGPLFSPTMPPQPLPPWRL